MQNTKPNRAERRAAQSNAPKPKMKSWRSVKCQLQSIARKRSPQIAAPSRATRFAGLT